jgi:chromosome segregation ATPase
MEESRSFLKKRIKKISKSFLVLFFKKERLPFLFLATLAHAQESPEDRLRAALRDSVTQMRAAQDQAATAQSQLTQAQNDLATLKAKYGADEAKIAQLAGTAKPDEVKQMKADLAAAQQQNAALQASLGKFQGAVTQAQDSARKSDANRQIALKGLESNTQALQTCKGANAKLITLSEQVLHLYQDHGFIWVLRKSYEPFVGAAKVDLQNLVQDYDDKIHDQEYIPPRTLAGAPHP